MKRLLILGAMALGPLSVYAAPASAEPFCSTPDAYSSRYSVRVGSGDRCPDYGRGRYDDRRSPGHYDGYGRGDDAYRRESRHAFRVIYRPSCNAGWREHGCYDCREDAERVARCLSRDGLEARVTCD